MTPNLNKLRDLIQQLETHALGRTISEVDLVGQLSEQPISLIGGL